MQARTHEIGTRNERARDGWIHVERFLFMSVLLGVGLVFGDVSGAFAAEPASSAAAQIAAPTPGAST